MNPPGTQLRLPGFAVVAILNRLLPRLLIHALNRPWRVPRVPRRLSCPPSLIRLLLRPASVQPGCIHAVSWRLLCGFLRHLLHSKLESSSRLLQFHAVPAATLHPPQLREQAKALYIQGFLPVRIAQQLGVNHRSVHSWVSRGGWRNIRDSITLRGEKGGIRAELVDRTQAGTSAFLRQKLAEVLQLHADALGMIKARPDLKQLAAVAEVIEALARSAKIVHDWGQGGQIGLILIDELRKKEPATVTCAPDATTESVPQNAGTSALPQLAEAIDVQSVASPAN